MRKRVLVTGASGFIGRYVVAELVRKGYETIALAHKTETDFDDRAYIYIADIRVSSQIDGIVKQIGQCDIVVHIAANLNIAGNDDTILTNCLGTYHIVNMAKMLKANQIIYLSSIPVIGKPIVLPITEEHPVHPNTLYHITKFMGEEIIFLECRDEVKPLILRISSPIGVGMSSGSYLSVLFQRFMNNEEVEVYGKGRRVQNYIDVRDVAYSVVKGIETEEKGVFLIGGSKGVSNIELAQLCKNITKSDSKIIIGSREDIEETNCWDICLDKARSKLNFVPCYNIKETLFWIYNSLKDVKNCGKLRW
ncbi:MAG: NAD(P)-dependent oxidoreductase [Ruminococcus flavefaciens]|nr:NAD(P)-dependent oxidoreductase [Ruminococcus flavefaciens]